MSSDDRGQAFAFFRWRAMTFIRRSDLNEYRQQLRERRIRGYWLQGLR